VRKGVRAHGLRRTSWGQLLVPLYDAAGALVNVQTISRDGDKKRFLKGGRMKG
jgi:phage/plasmid primase-like uncharacterized protein